MSPEQARGTADLDRRSDVYALGCLLYEILTLRAAFEGCGAPLLRRVREGDIPDVETRNAKRPPPPPLAELCTRAMALSPAERPATAREFGDALRAWLDGRAERERKHREAEALAAQGIASLRRYEALGTQADAAEKQAASLKSDYKPWQSVEEKDPWLAAQEGVTELRREMTIAFADSTALLNAALAAEERNATATRALGDLWAKRLAESEQQGAADDAAYALAMLTRYDDGHHAALITGDGTLELTSDAPGAEVTLHRFESRRGVLHEDGGRVLGTTPIVAVTLPMGSYLCVLKKEGYREVRYPVQITRGRRWQGSVRLLTEAEIGEEFVYVPGGPFVYGEGKDTTEKELADFLIRRTPVTFGEYGEFLAAVEVEQGVEAAAALIPSV
ncbi:MAG: PEGA domain-containing protein, partial [bacterium]|nr:PEGA domain-containing protein [bacterium]